MRKSVAAVTVGLLLVAGQAAALNTQTAARVGDRVGARADATSDFNAVPPAFGVQGVAGTSMWRTPAFVWSALALTAVVVATQDSGAS